jgi:hypothetical protein
MAEAAQSTHRRPGCFALLFAVALVIAAVVGAIAVHSRAQLNDIRELYESRGYPTSVDALDAWYAPVPPDQNAALGFLAAWKAGKLTEQADENLLPVLCTKESCQTIDLSDATTLGNVQALLAKNAEALKFAHAAAKLDAARYPGNLAEWPLQLDHYNKVAHVARLLLLEADVAVHANDTARATDALVSVYACARSFANMPLAMGLLQMRGIQSTANGYVMKALGTVTFKEAELDRIADAARAANNAASLDRAIAGEAVFGLYSNSPANPLARPTGGHDRAEYARLIRTLLDAAAMPLPDAIPVFESFDDRAPGSVTRITKPVTLSLAKVLPRMCLSDARARIHHELFEMMIAVEKFRMQRGALPADASELVPDFLPELRHDPYSNGTYQYARTEKGYSVSSFGPDRSESEPNFQLLVEP